MGKKRISELGSEEEAALKAKRAVKLEQKKLREGKEVNVEHKEPEPVSVESDSSQTTEPVMGVSHEEESDSKKSAKKVHVRSQSYIKARKLVDADKTYPLSDALELLKQVSLTSFDPTVEMHFTLKAPFSQTIELPYSTGKVRRIAVADEKTISEIESGKVNFDVLLASPAQMPKLVKFAKVLGPKGLMPNPKNGTVVADPEAAAKKMAGSISISLKTEKSAPIIHIIVGKLSQKPVELTKNIETVMAAIPVANLRKAVLKSTMSPAIKLQF